MELFEHNGIMILIKIKETLEKHLHKYADMKLNTN